jgi:hypothetical protein
VSHRPGEPLRDSGRESHRPLLSANGRYIAFSSESAALADGDSNSALDVFLYDRRQDTVMLVSHRMDDETQPGNRGSELMALSSDGRFVSFYSDASDIASSPDVNAVADAFLFGPSADAQPAANLRLDVSGPRLATVASELGYAITVDNLGPGEAVEVEVDHPTPPGLGQVETLGDCTSLFPCTFASIPPGQSRRITARFRVPPEYAGADPIVSRARVDAENPDPDFADNMVEATTPFNPPSGRLAFYAVPPCRLVDTRAATGARGGPALVGGVVRSMPVANGCGIPGTAKLVVVNLTVTGADQPGHIRVYRAGAPLPLVSTLNYVPGQTRANSAVVALSEQGAVSVFCGQAGGSAHLVIDVAGYYQ